MTRQQAARLKRFLTVNSGATRLVKGRGGAGNGAERAQTNFR